MMWLAVALGAAVGGTLRYALMLMASSSGALPWATLMANGAGALAIGALAAHIQFSPWSEVTRLFWMTGLLGGLTTFSTFSLESFSLLQRGHWLLALAHMLLHVVGCLALTAVGYAGVSAWRS